MWYCQFTLRTRRTERTFSFQSRRHSFRPSATITPAEHVNRNAADSEEVLMHGSDELDDFAPSIREPERAFRIAILLLLCPGSPVFPTEAHQSIPSRSVERENVFLSTISLTVHLWFDKIQYTLRTTRLKLPPIWSEGKILRMRRIATKHIYTRHLSNLSPRRLAENKHQYCKSPPPKAPPALMLRDERIQQDTTIGFFSLPGKIDNTYTLFSSTHTTDCHSCQERRITIKNTYVYLPGFFHTCLRAALQITSTNIVRRSYLAHASNYDQSLPMTKGFCAQNMEVVVFAEKPV